MHNLDRKECEGSICMVFFLQSSFKKGMGNAYTGLNEVVCCLSLLLSSTERDVGRTVEGGDNAQAAGAEFPG